MPKSLVARIRLIYFPLDLTFGILIPLAMVNGVEAKDTTYALFVLYALGIGRTILIMFGFGRVIGPVGRFLEATPADSTRFPLHALHPDGKELREIDAADTTYALFVLYALGI